MIASSFYVFRLIFLDIFQSIVVFHLFFFRTYSKIIGTNKNKSLYINILHQNCRLYVHFHIIYNDFLSKARPKFLVPCPQIGRKIIFLSIVTTSFLVRCLISKYFLVNYRSFLQMNMSQITKSARNDFYKKIKSIENSNKIIISPINSFTPAARYLGFTD